MTIGELIFYLILFVVVIFLLKIGIGIIIVLLMFAVVFIIFNWFISATRNVLNDTEYFNPVYDYSRVYPGTFAYRNGYGSFNGLNRLSPSSWPGNINVRRNGDYWYVPAYQYLNTWVNGPQTAEVMDGRVINNLGIPDSCITPATISQSCVNQRIQNSGNLDQVISDCSTPAKVSTVCPLQNWSDPMSPYNNDYGNYVNIVA